MKLINFLLENDGAAFSPAPHETISHSAWNSQCRWPAIRFQGSNWQITKSNVHWLVMEQTNIRRANHWHTSAMAAVAYDRRRQKIVQWNRTAIWRHKRVIWFYIMKAPNIWGHTGARERARRWHTNICQSNKNWKTKKKKQRTTI